MGFFSELLAFPQLINTYKKNFRVQKEFMAHTIELDIAEALKTNDGSIGEKDIQKIRTYYGNAVPAILGEGYAILRGKALTSDERTVQTYLGGLTGLFDDLFDEKEIEQTCLLEMINDPKESQAKTSFELLFLRFYIKALALGNRKRIIELLVKGFYAQVASLEQVQQDVSQERIAEITREKGGIFLQFYRAGFHEPPGSVENEMLYNIGAAGQLENDIFDLYKDHQDGIKTLSTTAPSIDELEKTYDSWISQYQVKLTQLNFEEKAITRFERFTRILYLRGKVCLSQYLQLETQMGGQLDVSKCTRKDLICDMGKLSNQLKLMGLYLMPQFRFKE
ncbi:MAG: hypothetical protein CL840_08795 [Crocinitomicaceae bacterium]|nr:hypothetical protein [Crocinitomicaceae bacterium]|tara:strand:- start:56042 stop:57049 length:1008 start_codon:yes stop_codon:yes gene_type:complete